MSVNWPWCDLDLEGPTSVRDIKRAYAKRLKTIDRSDPDVFQNLLRARDRALDIAHITSDEDASHKQDIRRPQIRDLKKQSRNENDYNINDKDASVPLKQQATSQTIVARKVDLKTLSNAEEPTPPIETVSFKQSRDVQKSDDFMSARTFLGNLEEFIKTKQYDAIATLFEQPVFQDRSTRTQAEYRLASCVSSYMENRKKIPATLFELIHREFDWSTDAVGTTRRLSSIYNIQLIIAYIANPNNKKRPLLPSQNNKKTPSIEDRQAEGIAILEEFIQNKQYNAIITLLQQSVFQDRNTRIQAEYRLASYVSSYMEDGKKIPASLFELIHQEFDWCTDAVGTTRRLSSIYNINLIIAYIANQKNKESVLSEENKPVDDHLTSKGVFYFFGFSTMIISIIYASVWGSEKYSLPLNIIIQIFLHVIPFFLCVAFVQWAWWLITPLRIIILDKLFRLIFIYSPVSFKKWIRHQNFIKSEISVLFSFIPFWILLYFYYKYT